MTEEARLFITWCGTTRISMDLFTANYGYANADWGDLRSEGARQGVDRVAFPAGSERRGLLGQASS